MNPDNDRNFDPSLPDKPARTSAAEILSGFVPAGRFLFGLGGRNDVVDSERTGWARAAGWLPVWGLLIGIVYAGIFRVAWLWLGEHQRLRLAPMAVLLAFDAGWLGYRLLEGATNIVGSWRRSDAPPPAQPWLPVLLMVILALLGKFALLVTLPAGNVPYPADWRQHLSIFYPYAMYRPLVLLPLWGRWGIMLATGIGRISPSASPRLHAMARHNRLPAVIGHWVVATALTVLYCSPAAQHVAWSMLIALAMLLVAYLASFILVTRFGGQTETSVLAVGWATEMTFLLVYLPVARSIYWY